MKLSSLLLYPSLGIIALSVFSSCTRNPVVDDYTFVVTGDDRIAPKEDSAHPEYNTINVYQVKRLFKEVSEMKPLPRMLIINGDLVLGYCDGDTVKLANELRAWIKLYKESPLAATSVKLIAFPGNHETAEKIGSGKIATVSDERTFVREMKDYIAGDNGPHYTGFRPGTDSLMSDQSKLTYSFDFGGDHYVIFNSDGVARESHLPYHWLEKDLKQARDNGARHIFLFAHKPAWATSHSGEAGLDDFKAARDSAWAVMEKYNADIYFCSHYHFWDTICPHRGKTYEVVCGNAGAPGPKDWVGPYYGFTVVKVHPKTIDITSMGRDYDLNDYTAARDDKATFIRAQFTIGK
ncbi:MAG TPA: metallophosphoesterase [Bacteroidia bacterium]|jgi:hypothetical protein|nr:metallophosphoesterase [Bacteroidia bacterium]